MKRFLVLALLAAAFALAPPLASAQTGHYTNLAVTPQPDATPTTGYNFYRGLTATTIGSSAINSSPVLVGCTIAAGNCNYSDPNVTVGVTYFYYAEAVVSGFSSIPSNTASDTILPFAPNVIATPH